MKPRFTMPSDVGTTAIRHAYQCKIWLMKGEEGIATCYELAGSIDTEEHPEIDAEQFVHDLLREFRHGQDGKAVAE